MPARHRHHDSTEHRKLFTITLESCSRSAGIRVHDAVETVITMSRNMHLTAPRQWLAEISLSDCLQKRSHRNKVSYPAPL